LSALRKLLQSGTHSDKLLAETADNLYNKICKLPYPRPVDFGYTSPHQDTYDQGISDMIDRFANRDFEASILQGLKCFSDILNAEVRSRGHRPQHLLLAFTFELIDLWIDKNRPVLVKSRTDGIRKKIEHLIDQYFDDLVINARALGITQPFEALVFVKEVRER
jgi:hypothetical protein